MFLFFRPRVLDCTGGVHPRIWSIVISIARASSVDKLLEKIAHPFFVFGMDVVVPLFEPRNKF